MASDPIRRSSTKTAGKAKVAATAELDPKVCRYPVPVEHPGEAPTKRTDNPAGSETVVEFVPCDTPWADHTPADRLLHVQGSYEASRLPYDSVVWREML